MVRHRLRLVETTATQSSVAFVIENDTLDMAAAQLLAAYQSATLEKRQAITLPDGQSGLLEQDDELGVDVAIEELDDEGEVIRRIEQMIVQRAMN